MHSHRRQLIQSLDLLAFTIFVYLWLLDKSTLSLFLRCFLQIQFCNPIQVHPIGWSPFKLRTLLCFQVGFNLIMILIHLSSSGIVSSSKGTNNLMEKGSAGQHTLIIDFIGQDYEPSKFHLVLIDLFLTMIQSVLLIVSYENGWDELEPSKQGQLSFLDDSDSDSEFGDAQDPGGQGWDLGQDSDEEANLFLDPTSGSSILVGLPRPDSNPNPPGPFRRVGPEGEEGGDGDGLEPTTISATREEIPSRIRERTNLTHPIVVLRLTELFQGFLSERSQGEPGDDLTRGNRGILRSSSKPHLWSQVNGWIGGLWRRRIRGRAEEEEEERYDPLIDDYGFGTDLDGRLNQRRRRRRRIGRRRMYTNRPSNPNIAPT